MIDKPKIEGDRLQKPLESTIDGPWFALQLCRIKIHSPQRRLIEKITQIPKFKIMKEFVLFLMATFTLGFVAQAQIANGRYVLYSSNGGNCLDVSNNSAERGALIQLWNCNGNDCQKWDTRRNDDGSFTFVSVRSGMCLDVSDNSSAMGKKIQQWDCNGNDCQKWLVNKNSDGSITLLSRRSGYALDVTDNGSQPGAILQQWESNGNNCQKWIAKRQ